MSYFTTLVQVQKIKQKTASQSKVSTSKSELNTYTSPQSADEELHQQSKGELLKEKVIFTI